MPNRACVECTICYDMMRATIIAVHTGDGLKLVRGLRGIGSWADYCLVSISQYYIIP